jgi:FdhD protein
MMTIGDHPEDLALGYLLNQNMPRSGAAVTGIDFDDEMGVVVVRTAHRTNFEAKLTKKTQTSGCAQGIALGDLMERLPPDLAAAEAWLKWPISA